MTSYSLSLVYNMAKAEFENETERVILKKFQESSKLSEISQRVELRFVTCSLESELPPFTTLYKHTRVSTPTMGAFQTFHCRMIDR
jgi:hypothetical protein